MRSLYAGARASCRAPGEVRLARLYLAYLLAFPQQIENTEYDRAKSDPDQSANETTGDVRRIMYPKVNPTYSNRKDQYDEDSDQSEAYPRGHSVSQAKKDQKSIERHRRHGMTTWIT